MTPAIRHLFACALAAIVVLPSPATAQSVPREGFWFGAGAGAGRAGVTCDDCNDDADGCSGA